MRWWEPLAVVPVVACLGWLIVLFALGFILGLLFAFLGYGAEVREFAAKAGTNFFVIQISIAIFYLAVVFAVRRDLRKRHQTTVFACYFPPVEIRALLHAGFSGLLLAGVYVVVILGVSWTSLWHFHLATGKFALQPRSLGQLAISGLVFIALVPLAEEIYFRGLLLDWLQQKLSPLLSAALTAAVFSLMHFQFLLRPGFPGWSATAAIAALGVLTALWVQRTHSLRAPVAAHAAYNLTVMLVLFFVRFVADSPVEETGIRTIGPAARDGPF
jgi:membrane protease YdiL (CAAX protease family)